MLRCLVSRCTDNGQGALVAFGAYVDFSLAQRFNRRG
jgi:hypothetical protein